MFYKHRLEDGKVIKFLTKERFALYLDKRWKMNSIEENMRLNKLNMKHCDFRTMKGVQYSITMRLIFCFVISCSTLYSTKKVQLSEQKQKWKKFIPLSLILIKIRTRAIEL